MRERGQIFPERSPATSPPITPCPPACSSARRRSGAELDRSVAGSGARNSASSPWRWPGWCRCWAPDRPVADRRRFPVFRLAFLAFTLVFVGWYAQAQLSIVTLIGLVRAATVTHDLPPALRPALAAALGFVLVSLLIWGRGTFCGWLCPFGALQEFVALLAKPLRFRQVAVPPWLDRWLRQVKYGAAGRHPRRGGGGLASRRQPGRGGAVQDRHHPVLRAGLALRRLRRRSAYLQPLRLQGVSAATCVRSRESRRARRLRLLDWIPRGPSAAARASSARCAAATARSGQPGRSIIPSASSAWIASTIIHDPGQCVPQWWHGGAKAESSAAGRGGVRTMPRSPSRLPPHPAAVSPGSPGRPRPCRALAGRLPSGPWPPSTACRAGRGPVAPSAPPSRSPWPVAMQAPSMEPVRRLCRDAGGRGRREPAACRQRPGPPQPRRAARRTTRAPADDAALRPRSSERTEGAFDPTVQPALAGLGPRPRPGREARSGDAPRGRRA